MQVEFGLALGGLIYNVVNYGLNFSWKSNPYLSVLQYLNNCFR